MLCWLLPLNICGENLTIFRETQAENNITNSSVAHFWINWRCSRTCASYVFMFILYFVRLVPSENLCGNQLVFVSPNQKTYSYLGYIFCGLFSRARWHARQEHNTDLIKHQGKIKKKKFYFVARRIILFLPRIFLNKFGDVFLGIPMWIICVYNIIGSVVNVVWYTFKHH